MKENTKVMLALFGGLVAGAALGILLAPEKGSETRRKIAEAAKKFGARLKEELDKEGKSDNEYENIG